MNIITDKDFTPTKETISLHGLGFIQLVLPGNQRLHVWHPELPRRKCYEFSDIHNHRFSFWSRILKGTQVNQRVDIELVKDGSHSVISHNGPRSERGGRISQPVAQCNVYRSEKQYYKPGDSYFMNIHEYHCTPNEGIVITLMNKEIESHIHANSIILNGVDFDYDFDRFQLPPEKLFEYVVDAFRS